MYGYSGFGIGFDRDGSFSFSGIGLGHDMSKHEFINKD